MPGRRGGSLVRRWLRWARATKEALQRAACLRPAIRGSERSIVSSGSSGCVDSDSDDDDNRMEVNSDAGEAEEAVRMVPVVDGRVPSLFEVCARAIAQDKRLVARLYYNAPLGIEYLWEVVKEAQERQEEFTRTNCTLNMRGCRDSHSVLGRTVGRRMSKCDRLVSLILDDCTGLTDNVLHGVAIPRGKVGLPHLERLSVAGCPLMTDNSLEHVIRIYGPRLKVVRLSNSGATQRCVKALARYSTNLEVAAFSHQLHVRDKHMLQLVMGCPRLKQIEASYCSLITDVSVMAIAKNLWALETLDLSYCDQVGPSIESLQQCKFLQGLRLQNCPRVTDSILKPVLQWCSLLEVLCVRSCPLVGMATIDNISSHCGSLRALDIMGVSADGNKALAVLAKSDAVRHTLKEFCSTQRVVLRMTSYIWELFVPQ
ncbi:unnamed protein product [Ostreobium quekettii]|uniref:Uncharacterized protein n=1 Tax=Ostreobium quekettii TaxID=121088 RepID=A0A8S1J0J3_9CHLO|nr:unnamed protein product [Ostreobium quekettii]